MKKIISYSLIVYLLFFFTVNLHSCTTFCIKDENNIVFGKNFDFVCGYGFVVINKRNATKTAYIGEPEKPFSWTAKYGSITFNQIGKEFPYGGMNEVGLVIEQMWLEDSQYPELDERYGLSELQWIQYQLDKSATVDDIIASDSAVRISFTSQAPLHFLVCDKYRNLATIEYLNGKTVYHRGKDLPFPALANSSYEQSIEFLQELKRSNLHNNISYRTNSLDRFAKAAMMVSDNHNRNMDNIIDYSFSILKAVSQGESTHWSIVYDIKNMRIFYKTYQNKKIRSISLSDFNFNCQLPVLIIDIEKDIKSGSNDFTEYNTELNGELLEKVFNSVSFLKNIPEATRIQMNQYTKTVKCAEY